MRQHWWKILAVLILAYVFVAGMLTPLGTGIVGVSPTNTTTGQTIELAVTGYNSHYEKGKDGLRVWLKMSDDYSLAATSIAVENDRQLKATFDIPAYLPTDSKVQDFTLIIDNKADGYALLPSALFITQQNIAPSSATTPSATISNLNTNAATYFPFRNILSESIRNTYFHVPLWFGMLFLFIASVYHSALYLRSFDNRHDHYAVAYTKAGLLYGILGLITGAIWAKYTWGAFWSWDIKQNMTAIALLIYGAYFVLRNSFEDDEKKSRISAVYNIFAFITLIPLLVVIPRLTDSLHPGNGGNPAIGGEDLDNTMRMVFYPAIIGWTLLGFWISQISYRAERLRNHLLER